MKCKVRAKHQKQQSTTNKNGKRTKSNTEDPDTVRNALPKTRTRPAVDSDRTEKTLIHDRRTADPSTVEPTKMIPSSEPTAPSPTYLEAYRYLLAATTAAAATAAAPSPTYLEAQRYLLAATTAAAAPFTVVPNPASIKEGEDAVWNQRFEELKKFKEKHGHCRVPRNTPKLGVWVKKQRGVRRASNSEERTIKLQEIGLYDK